MSVSMLRRWAGLGACTVVAIGGVAGVPNPVRRPPGAAVVGVRHRRGALGERAAATHSAACSSPTWTPDPWTLRHGLTDAQLDREIDANVNLMRFVDLETFVVGGTRRYAALWSPCVSCGTWGRRSPECRDQLPFRTTYEN